jgi:hypothetical protein
MKRLLLVILVVFLIFSQTWAQEKKTRSLTAIEFFSGFARADLEEKKDYHLIPFIVDFDFNLKKLTEKIGFNPPVLIQFQLEPFIAFVSQPRKNVEIGNSFVLKIGLLPETSKIQPYIKGGPGIVYMSQHTREQGTQFNFTEYGGAGIHWFFKKNMAFTLEYRYRHTSNAGIKDPNSGIDTSFVLAGISYQF